MTTDETIRTAAARAHRYDARTIQSVIEREMTTKVRLAPPQLLLEAPTTAERLPVAHQEATLRLHLHPRVRLLRRVQPARTRSVLLPRAHEQQGSLRVTFPLPQALFAAEPRSRIGPLATIQH